MALLPLLKCGSGLMLQGHAIGTTNHVGHDKISSGNFLRSLLVGTLIPVSRSDWCRVPIDCQCIVTV